MFHLRLLGRPELATGDGEPVVSVVSQPKRLALLAYLAADSGRRPTRDQLLGVFWPESTDEDARNALKQALHYLRRSLGESSIVRGGDGRHEIDRAVIDCDVVTFEELVAAGELESALSLYDGDLAEGLYVAGCPEFDHWKDQRAATLRRSAIEAAALLAQQKGDAGDLAGAVDFARRAVGLDPYDEYHVRALMVVLAESGGRAEAISTFDAFERRFEEELGLAPAPETLELVQKLREAPPAPQPTSSTRVTPPPIDVPPSADSARPRSRLAAAAVVMVLAATALVAGRSFVGGPGDERPPRLIVLPFANLGDSATDYFAEGMTEEITATLAGIEGLHVLARQTAIQYSDSPLSAREIADQLDVDYVLEGTVRTDRAPDGGGQVRITPQLIRGSDEAHVWAEPYTAELTAGEIFRTQVEIATRVAIGMDVVLPQADLTASRGTESPEAYDFYLRGRSYFGRERRRLSDYQTAADFFERALAIDSSYVEAYAMLARAYSEIGAPTNFSQAGYGDRAKVMAEKAIALAPDDADANLAMGVYYMSHTEEPETALEHLGAARQARPNDAYVLQRLAAAQGAMGLRDEAHATREAALEVDPRSVPILRALSTTHARAGRYSEAVALYDRMIALVPDGPTPYFRKTLSYLLMGEGEERARSVVEAADGRADLVSYMLVSWDFDDQMVLRLFADHFDPKVEARSMADADTVAFYFAKADAAARRDDARTARAYYDSARVVLEARQRDGLFPGRTTRNLGLAYAMLGHGEEARALAGEMVGRTETAAQALMVIGDHDEAVELLAELHSTRPFVSAPVLRIDPLWDPLREHPGFEALVAGG